MKRTRGQTLIEMIVIVGVVVLLVTGIVAATTASLSVTNSNAARSSAIQYAQEGIELARAQRDVGWNSFALLGTPRQSYCVGSNNEFQPTAIMCDYINVGNQFIRTITLELINPGDPTQVKMTVDVVVSWGDTTNPNNNVELKTDLTQWR